MCTQACTMLYHIPGRQVCKSTQCFSDRKGRNFSMGSCSGFSAMWATGPWAKSVSLPKAEPFNGGDTRARSCYYLQPREGCRCGRGGSSCLAATSGSPSREHGPAHPVHCVLLTQNGGRGTDTEGVSLLRGLGHHGCLAQGHPAWRRGKGFLGGSLLKTSRIFLKNSQCPLLKHSGPEPTTRLTDLVWPEADILQRPPLQCIHTAPALHGRSHERHLESLSLSVPRSPPLEHTGDEDSHLDIFRERAVFQTCKARHVAHRLLPF